MLEYQKHLMASLINNNPELLMYHIPYNCNKYYVVFITQYMEEMSINIIRMILQL